MATQALPQAKAEHLPPFLAAIDLSTYTGDGQIDQAKELAYTGGLFAQATAATLDQAFALLKETVARIPIYLDVSALEEQQDVVDLLDGGAAKVFVSSTQLSSLTKLSNLDSSRIVIRPTGDASSILDGTSYAIHLNIADAGTVGSLLKELGSERPPVYVSQAQIAEHDAVELSKLGAVPIIPAPQLTTAAESTEGQIRVARV